jgi:polyphosphate glucokinase
MKVLVIDIGGNNVKILATGQTEARKAPSGPKMTPEQMVSAVKELAAGWEYDVVSIGYPGFVRRGQIELEPHNLASGWVGFNFEAAFGCRVKLMNDAAMQALGSYKGGFLLFLGLGTGLGSALVVKGVVVPMELGQLSYKNGTVEHYVGDAGRKRLGRKKWQRHVEFGVARLIAGIRPDDVVLGGGNARKLKKLPEGCRAGDNANAFVGGFRLWTESSTKGASKAASKAGTKTHSKTMTKASTKTKAKTSTNNRHPAPTKPEETTGGQHEHSAPGSDQGTPSVESSGKPL